MEAIDWLGFLWMMPFCFFGFAFHFVIKYGQARKKENFSNKKFVKKQWLGWVIAWGWCLIGSYLIIRKAIFLEGSYDIIALFIGLSGGYIGKKLSRTIMRKFTVK